MTDSTTVSYPKAVQLSEIKPGDYIGTTATPDSEGRLVAREIHLFAETARVVLARAIFLGIWNPVRP